MALLRTPNHSHRWHLVRLANLLFVCPKKEEDERFKRIESDEDSEMEEMEEQEESEDERKEDDEGKVAVLSRSF